MGPAPSRMVWPPKIKSIEPLGEIVDINKRKIPRDGGRAVRVGKHMYYVFGDTYCFDDNVNFVGCANNTLAWIPDWKRPLESSYLTDDPCVPPFIPLTKEEAEFGKEHEKEGKRFVTWCFGGLIEDEDECGSGWMWFEKCEGHGGNLARSDGVRVCRVTTTEGHHIKAERTLPDERIFRDNEPQFGNVACVRDGEWDYCIGGQGLENFLARAKHGCDLTKRSNYQFWGQNGWVDDYNDIKELQSLLWILGQGQIINTGGNGPDGKKFMLFCNEKWPTSQIIVGWAHHVEGPWEWQTIGHAPAHWEGRGNMRYAMFPHMWAYDWNQGELMMTYSDDGQMGGTVVAMKICFEVEAPPQ